MDVTCDIWTSWDLGIFVVFLPPDPPGAWIKRETNDRIALKEHEMTKAHKVYQPLTSISELYLLPKKTKNDTETTTGDCCRELLLDDLSDLPAKLSSPCCDHCRSSIVFSNTQSASIKTTLILVSKDIPPYPAHSKHVPKLAPSRAPFNNFPANRQGHPASLAEMSCWYRGAISCSCIFLSWSSSL